MYLAQGLLRGEPVKGLRNDHAVRPLLRHVRSTEILCAGLSDRHTGQLLAFQLAPHLWTFRKY